MSKTTPTIRDTTPSKVPMSNAERQRKHREKRKAELMALRAGAAASLSRRLALPSAAPAMASVAVPALLDGSPALRMQLEAARKRCEAQAAELAALRAEHEPLVAVCRPCAPCCAPSLRGYRQRPATQRAVVCRRPGLSSGWMLIDRCGALPCSPCFCQLLIVVSFHFLPLKVHHVCSRIPGPRGLCLCQSQA